MINIFMYDFSIPQDYRRYLIDNITRILPSLSDYQLALLLDETRACQTCVPEFGYLTAVVSLPYSKFKKNCETQKKNSQK